MITTGDKLTLLAEIIRVSTKGATESEITGELSLTSKLAKAYIRFLRSKNLIVLVDDRDYFPSTKGLAYLSTFDEAADLIDVDEPDESSSQKNPAGKPGGVHWDKAELAARMRDIIDR